MTGTPSTPLTGTEAVTREIVANALASIADEMATTIFRTAHSTVVRDAMDFSAALLGRSGETVAQAVSVPLHLGSIPTAMESLLDRYGGEIGPGDVFIMNDPFDGGMHLQDIFIAKPIHHQGELLGFGVATAHHADVGGRVPGSAACDNTEIFQEGLRLPWVRLYRGGEPVQDMFKLIAGNVRVPRMTLGDIAAQVAACTVADRLLGELAERYGHDQLEEMMLELVDHTERLVRGGIAAWPDGKASFRDYIDSDGIDVRDVAIEVEVEISGDELTVDFSRSAPMVAGALNSTPAFVAAAAYQAVQCALALEVPSTSGAFRPINVVTKPGTVTHVTMPGASSMRGVTGLRAFDAVNGALAQLLPDRVPAAGEGGNTVAVFGGTQDDGSRFIYLELVCGTWGGNPERDGNDGLTHPSAAASNIPIEAAEMEYPIFIERYGFVQDSGGAGRHRGGVAIERAWRPLVEEMSLVVRSDRQRNLPWGLRGGQPGRPSRNTIRRRDGSEEALPPMFTTTLREGECYHHEMAGGGGWGDPLERPAAAVATDVLDEKVSRDAAFASYGVVLAGDGGVDEQGTADRRAELLRTRLGARGDGSHG